MAKTEPKDLMFGFSRPVVELTRLINPELTRNEMATFLYEAWRLGLDPASGKQIYAVIYNRNDAQKRKMSVQIAIDGKRAIAAATGEYDGSDEIEFGPEVDSDGVKHPEWARARVWRKGCANPFVATVRWSERRKLDRYSNAVPKPLTEFWHDQPYAMLGKCAESAALGKCFPLQMRGHELDREERDEDPGHDEAPIAEARVVDFPAPSPSTSPGTPPVPVAKPASEDPKWVVTSIRDVMEDPAVRDTPDVNTKAHDLLNTRLDAMGLKSVWDAKAEHIPTLKALLEDLRRVASGK